MELMANESIAFIEIVGWSKELNSMPLKYSTKRGFEKQKWIPIANKELYRINGELKPRCYYERDFIQFFHPALVNILVKIYLWREVEWSCFCWRRMIFFLICLFPFMLHPKPASNQSRIFLWHQLVQ